MVMTCYDLMPVEKVMARDPFSSTIGFKGSSIQLNGYDLGHGLFSHWFICLFVSLFCLFFYFFKQIVLKYRT